MSAHIVRTPAEGEPPMEVPVQPDGSPYTVRATYDDGWLQAWATEDADIVKALIGGEYSEASLTRRAELRLELLSRAQVREMAKIAVYVPGFAALSEEQTKIWLGPHAGPLALSSWDGALALPQIRQWYRPIGLAAQPEGNIHWLDAATETSFLHSMAELGAIELSRRETDSDTTAGQ